MARHENRKAEMAQERLKSVRLRQKHVWSLKVAPVDVEEHEPKNTRAVELSPDLAEGSWRFIKKRRSLRSFNRTRTLMCALLFSFHHAEAVCWWKFKDHCCAKWNVTRATTI